MSLVAKMRKIGGEEASTVDPCIKSRRFWSCLHGDHSAEAVATYFLVHCLLWLWTRLQVSHMSCICLRGNVGRFSSHSCLLVLRFWNRLVSWLCCPVDGIMMYECNWWLYSRWRLRNCWRTSQWFTAEWSLNTTPELMRFWHWSCLQAVFSTSIKPPWLQR